MVGYNTVIIFMDYIHIKGARCHNLKNINVSIPKNMITVVTGISGSGKSSLVFDTLFAEGQRRFFESVSNFARQFLSNAEKPDVSRIDGLSPTIAISQRSGVSNPRSTVGTITEVYDYLRLVFSLAGSFSCLSCGKRISQQEACALTKCPFCKKTLPELSPRVFSFNNPEGACIECQGLGEKSEIDPELLVPSSRLSLEEGAIKPLMSSGAQRSWFWRLFLEVLKENNISSSVPYSTLHKEARHIILYGIKNKIYRTVINGCEEFIPFDGIIAYLEKRYKETTSSFLKSEIERYMRVRDCPACRGSRLHPFARSVTFCGVTLDALTALTIKDAVLFFKDQQKISNRTIAEIISEIHTRLLLLCDSGISYLTLGRSSVTLSGGELQRIRLATQIQAGLTGVTYILDEPSMGLHNRDIGQLITVLQKLKNLGNTIVVVEHDRTLIKNADYIIDIGPGAGEHGGEVVASCTVGELKKYISSSQTAAYVYHHKEVTGHRKKRKGNGRKVVVVGAREHNLKNITVEFPLGTFICVTGVSGSGKSTLVNDILGSALAQKFYRAKAVPGHHTEIRGTEYVNKVINVDQSAIGRSPRSNPATYTGLFKSIRDFYAELPIAKQKRFGKDRFSFNVPSGRCPVCLGEGQIKIEMYFLGDMYVTCHECKGKRYTKETLNILWHDKSIADILDMSVDEAYDFFEETNLKAVTCLAVLKEVGLGYIRLGQSATTLSGGEAQRVKLATELARKSTGNTLYILDEPTVGLHFEDIKHLLVIVHALTDKGNTVIVIEHNIDVIQSCDWVIDMGKEGGNEGGYIVAQGTPQDIAKVRDSYTGQFLK